MWEVVLVTFVPHRGDIKGENSEFKKIAFIDRRYRGNRPRVGEQWYCRVVGDSQPTKPDRGALFLTPMYQHRPQAYWSVKALEGATPAIEVSYERRLGDQVLNEKRWVVASVSDVDTYSCLEPPWWPDWLQDQVLALLSERARVLRAEQVLADRRARYEQMRALATAQLKGAVSVTICGMTFIEHQLTWEDHEVFADGQMVGLLFHNTSVDLKPEQFPFTVHERRLTLSNGNHLSVYSHEVQALVGGPKSRDKEKSIFARRCETQFFDANERWLPFTKKLTWEESELLSEGDFFAVEYPFQWLGDWLTNGVVWFPRQRPERREWLEYPISAVPRELWDLFLRGLEGKFLAELIPFHKQVTQHQPHNTETRLTERQRQVQAVINGQMWEGDGECERVSVGKNVVFHVNRGSLPPLYLVDNPGVGAIYVFHELDEAVQFAEGTVTRTEGIQRGYKRIIHGDGWQEKLSELLRSEQESTIAT